MTRYFRKPHEGHVSHFEVTGLRTRAERVYANGDRYTTQLTLEQLLGLVEIRELEEINHAQVQSAAVAAVSRSFNTGH